MSKPAIRDVEFYTEGKLVQITTDAETARAIGKYKDFYNKISSFDISHKTSEQSNGLVREVYMAQSHRTRIVCIKEYLPDVSAVLNAARYQCGILNKKKNEVDVIDNATFDKYYGSVPMLYYKLFREHVK